MSGRAAGVEKVGVQGYSATPKIPTLAAASQAGVALRGETEPHSRATRTKRDSARLRADQRKKPAVWRAFFVVFGDRFR